MKLIVKSKKSILGQCHLYPFLCHYFKRSHLIKTGKMSSFQLLSISLVSCTAYSEIFLRISKIIGKNDKLQSRHGGQSIINFWQIEYKYCSYFTKHQLKYNFLSQQCSQIYAKEEQWVCNTRRKDYSMSLNSPSEPHSRSSFSC